jgi:acetate kinase
VKVLVINSGSSSLKYHLFETAAEKVLFSGQLDKIGLEGATHEFNNGNGDKTVQTMELPDHGSALDAMLSTLTRFDSQVLNNIKGVSHRLVPGRKFFQAAVITPDLLDDVRRSLPMFPLHLPAMLLEIDECLTRMQEAVHVAVFDSWFHWSIPDEAAVYGLPYKYFSEFGFRRIGYHGFSHYYVAEKASQFLGIPLDRLKIISCHLGNGCSLCAIDRGKSVDTTMGMTSLEGLIMGTRSGDVDTGLIPIIMKQESMTPERLIELLYKESGLLGLSGVSRNMQDIEKAREQGNHQASLAFRAFCHKIKRYVGSMLMVLGGCDVLVFTGGIGENSSAVRLAVMRDAKGIGFHLDPDKNADSTLVTQENPVKDITGRESKIRILAIRSFEELIMARQCVEIVKNVTTL